MKTTERAFRKFESLIPEGVRGMLRALKERIAGVLKE